MNTKRGRKKEGFLHVKLSSRSTLGKAWKRKWVVVQHNTSSTGKSLLLELYMEKGAYHKTVTSLLLEGVVKVQRTTSKTQDHAIEISSASKVLLAVSADSEQETQEWLSMFRISLLPPVKELPCPPGIPEDFIRVSVMPNKDSDRLKLVGDYFAHISLASINLYNTQTGALALEWDLRHLKKFMLISKSHSLDVEKIVHILPSNRSPHGEGEFIFFSAKSKQLVEGIYERLSTAMTVKSRRSRSASMLFEITPQELEQMLKAGEQPPEETFKEADEEENVEEKGVVNGVAAKNEVEPGSRGIGDKEDLKTEESPTASEGKDDAEAKGDDKAAEEDETPREEGKNNRPEETDAQDRDANHEVKIQNGDVQVSPPDATLGDVAQQLGTTSVASESRDAATENSVDEMEEGVRTDVAQQEDDKANQTNPEEMDVGLGDDSDRKAEEQTSTNIEIVVSSHADEQIEDAIETTTVEQVETQPVDVELAQGGTSEVIAVQTSGTEEPPPETNDSPKDATPGDPSENDASDTKIEESDSSALQTKQVAANSPQETPDSKVEDAAKEMDNELESGLQEEKTSVENSDCQKETVEADDGNTSMHQDLQDQEEQSSNTNEIPPAATVENVPVKEGEGAELAAAAEPVKDIAPDGSEQEATGELSETANAEQVPDKVEPINIPQESTPEVTVDAAETVPNQTEEEVSKESANDPNLNLNNSNANLPTRPNSKTDFPLSQHDAEKSAEIIV